MNIDWDKAPEGTTHAIKFNNYFWRRVDGGEVYSWIPREGRWEERPFDDKDHWLELYGDIIVERPAPEPKLPELPHGYKWEDAPEGTTHFHCQGDRCWWIIEGKGGEYSSYPLFSEVPKWDHFGKNMPNLAVIGVLIARNGGAKPKGQVIILDEVEDKPALKEAPKKQVGWWS